MLHRAFGQYVCWNAAALLVAQDRTRNARPPAHQSERMADSNEAGFGMAQDRVEKMEQRRFPVGRFADALRAPRHAVVLPRIEVSRTAGRNVDFESSVRAGGQ